MARDVSMLSAGLAALEGGDFAAAERCFRDILGAQPANPDAWNALAWTYLRSGEAQLALEHAQRAHELSRRNVEYLNTLGVAHGESGTLAEAEACFRKALKLQPSYLDALVNLAKALEKQERLEEAGRLYARALAMAPAFPKLASSLASVYLRGGELDKASSLLETSRAIDVEDRVMLQAQCDLERGEAESAAARLSAAVRQNPGWGHARNSLALALLGAGEWREGWRQYLHRPHLAPRPPPAPLPPRLDGMRHRLKGEQGIGDVLFFLRFAPLLRERGAALAVDCESKLHPLLPAELLEGGAFDRELMLGDLPGLLETSATPSALPLHLAEDEKHEALRRLAALGPRPYLAVTWRAGTDTARARDFGEERKSLAKALPPQALGAALRGWRGTVLLLQRGARPGDAAQFALGLQASAHDLSALGDDLRALLGVLAALDEYVAVSNTNMHLLAGLGRTARVLVPRPPEWRWMHAGEASPWFPGFALYRQPVSRDWSEPLARLRKDLEL